MAVITVKALQALTSQDNGRRISMGESLYGTVRAGADGAISLHVVWRYKVGGKVRQTAVGTWKESGGKSLRELREIKNQLGAGIWSASAHKSELQPGIGTKNSGRR